MSLINYKYFSQKDIFLIKRHQELFRLQVVNGNEFKSIPEVSKIFATEKNSE